MMIICNDNNGNYNYNDNNYDNDDDYDNTWQKTKMFICI
jgi:hypothetical protein